MKKYLLFAAIALGGGLTALLGAHWMGWGAVSYTSAGSGNAPVQFAHYTPGGPGATVADFTFAAEKSLPVVVHISSSVRVKRSGPNLQGFGFDQLPEQFRQFFQGPRMREGPDGGDLNDMQEGTGSGVVLSADGYIVTNNHVVRNADELTVTLNDKRSFKAEVIGVDPSTDLALVKIDASGLPFAQLANSDNARVGEWVVAVGNPFNLAGTVTAGIVSAKGRDIHIVQDKAPIESFIQTDAVVNPGNSGGALLNLNGELIGINTAIASPTGVYAGYAFAIPSNLVAKVVEDLKQYGVVQRGYLGITIREAPGEKGGRPKEGILVDSLVENSAAGEAGIKKGDIITKIDGQSMNSAPELLEKVGKHRPGDKLRLTVLRNDSERDIDVVLKNRAGNTGKVKKQESGTLLSALGADFETVDAATARKLGIDGGVQIKNLSVGKLSNQTDVREGFIITGINNRSISDVDELSEQIRNASGGIMLEGIYPNAPNRKYYYAFGM